MADRNGYIGRAPGDSAVTVARQTFSPTGITTDFTFASGYTVGYLDLFLNGTKLIEGVDYNATDASTISLVSAAINGDVLEGVAYKAFNLGDARRIGIQSGGALLGNVDTLNFIGTGNTFALNGTTIDVSISGGGAGAGGTWSNYDTNTGVTTTKKVKIQNNLEVTGVSTFAAVNATTGSFSGNVGVAGVLTYEDVTNVDSVGLVTAGSGVRIVGGGLTVTGVSTFFSKTRLLDDVEFHVGTNGSSGNYKYYRDSGNTLNVLYEDISGAEARFVSNLAGDSNANFHFFKASTALARFSVDSTQLYSGGVAKFETTGGGVNVIGVATGTAFAGYDYLQAPFSTTVNFAVTVATKTAAHRYPAGGSSSSNGYVINGVQSPFLTLTPGRTYRFVHDNTGSHPLKFYLEADKTTLYSTGVTFDNAYTEIVVSDSTPQVLHYQCTNHGYMGNAVYTNSNAVVSTSAAIFKSGLVEKYESAGTTLGAQTANPLSDGNVILFTGNESGNTTINFTGVHATLSNGETVSFTAILTPNNSGVINVVQVDGQPITVKWSGGSAPSAGASGQDIYTFQILKTGTGTSDYTVFGAAANYA